MYMHEQVFDSYRATTTTYGLLVCVAKFRLSCGNVRTLHRFACFNSVQLVFADKLFFGNNKQLMVLCTSYRTVFRRFCCPLKQSVSVRPSVCLRHHLTAATACGGFAAERRVAEDIDRQRRDPGVKQQRRRSTGPQHGAQQQIRAVP